VNSYLIPQTVYVGDRATLVITLHHAPVNGLVLTGEPPALPDLVIHRVELERRGETGRLLIDFTAYVPGRVELPPFEIEGIPFTGLYIEIASILGTDETASVLSPPAPPLAVPGTGVLVYGTVSGLVLFLLMVVWALAAGPRRFAGWLKKWRRKRLIASLAGMERRLRRKLIRENPAVKNFRGSLNFLAAEFRTFLALFTGENCRAMTAGELSGLSLPELAAGENFYLSGAFLGGFFRRCDDLRFSGAEAPKSGLRDMLGELKAFTAALNRAERSRPAVLREAVLPPVMGRAS
jgi:hypothetical protein